jgi:hypothetical protein
LRLAISRAVAIESSRGWRIAKEKQAHKIDVVVALAMAALCCVKAQGEDAWDVSGRWISEGPTPPEPADVVAARRQKLYELLRSGQPVPF